MSRKTSLLIFLLVLSLSFNAFFILGAMRALPASVESGEPAAENANETEPAPQPAETVLANELNLNEQQRTVYDRLAAQHADERARLIEEQTLAREELINAFNEEAPDRMRIRELIEQYVSITAQLQAESAAKFREFMNALTPAQRAVIANRIRSGEGRQGEASRPLPPNLREFDLDGDGQLNPREAHRARTARREMGPEEWQRRHGGQ